MSLALSTNSMQTKIKLYHELSENVKAKAREKALEWQVRPEEVVLALDIDDNGQPAGLKFDRAPGKAYAGALEAANSVIPTTAGIATGVALAPSTGGLLSFAGGAGAGMAAGKVQDWALRKALPGVARDLDIARQYYPKLTTAAQAAGALAGNKQLLLNKGALLSKAGLDVARNQGARGVAALALKEAGGARGLAKNLGIGAGAGVGFEGWQQIQEKKFSPERLLTAGVANALVGGGAPRRGTVAGANLLRRGFGKAPIDSGYNVAARPAEQPAVDNWKELKDFTEAYKAEIDPVKQKALWETYSARHPEWSSPEAVVNTGEAIKAKDEAILKAREKAEEQAKKEEEKAAIEEKKKGIGLDFDPKKLVDQTVDETSRIVKAFAGKVYDGVKVDRSIVESATPEVKAKMLAEAARIEAETAAAEAAAKQKKEAERKAKQAAEQAKKPTKAEQQLAKFAEALKQTELPTAETKPTAAEPIATKTTEDNLAVIERNIKLGADKLKQLAENPAASEEALTNLSDGLARLEKLYYEGGGKPENLKDLRLKVWLKKAKAGPPSNEQHKYVQRTVLTGDQAKTFEGVGKTEWSNDPEGGNAINKEEWEAAYGNALARVLIDPNGITPESMKRAWNTARKAAFRQRQGEVRLPEGEAGDTFLARAAGEGQPARTGELEEGNVPGAAAATEAGTGLQPAESTQTPDVPAAEAPAKPSAAKPTKAVKSKAGQVFEEGGTYTLLSKLGNRPVRIAKLYKATADLEELSPEMAGKTLTKVPLNKLSAENISAAKESIQELANDPEGIDKVADMPGLSAEMKADVIAEIRKQQAAKKKDATPSPEAPPMAEARTPINLEGVKASKTGQEFKPVVDRPRPIHNDPTVAKEVLRIKEEFGLSTDEALAFMRLDSYGSRIDYLKAALKKRGYKLPSGEQIVMESGTTMARQGTHEEAVEDAIDSANMEMVEKFSPDSEGSLILREGEAPKKTTEEYVKFLKDVENYEEAIQSMENLSASEKAALISLVKEAKADKPPPPVTSETHPAEAPKTTKTGQEFKPGSQALGVIPQPPEWAKRAAIATGKAIGKTERTIKNIAKDFKRSWDGEDLTIDAGHLVGKAGDGSDVLSAENVYRDLKNKLHPDELELLNDAGFESFMKGEKTRGEIGQWIEENGPRVEVVVKGRDLQRTTEVEKKYQEFRNRQAAILHELDSISPIWQRHVVWTTPSNGKMRYEKSPMSETSDLPERAWKLLEEFNDIQEKRLAVNSKTFSHKQEPSWQSIAPKPKSEMPGYAEIAVTVPVKIERWTDPQGNKMADRQVKFPSSHDFPDNTLGWVRGYMETLPSGKKAFRVIEVQSDWASNSANAVASRLEIRPHERYPDRWIIWNNDNNVIARPIEGFDPRMGFASKEEAQAVLNKHASKNDHPLLKQYNRLALKAAIAHAKKQGADYLVIDDAETAMLTERHDQAARMIKKVTPKQAEEYIPTDGRSAWGRDWESGTYAMVIQYGKNTPVRIDKPSVHRNDVDEKLAEAIAAEYPNGQGLTFEGETPFIKQEGGMRFNYDPSYRVLDKSTGEQLTDWTFPTAEDAQAWARANRVKDYQIVRGQLHKLAEELTGDEGRPGRFGTHKEAMTTRERLAPGEPFEEPRKNLIFTDLETGKPKTESTGRIYSLDKVESAPSLFNPDKIPSGPRDHRGNLYSNPFGVLWTEGVKSAGRVLDFVDRWAFRPWMGGEFEKARTLPPNPTEADKARATAAEALRDAKSDFDREFVRLNNQFARTIDESLRGETYTDREVSRVTQHADFLQDLGTSPIALTPKEQKLFNAFEKTKMETGGERITDGPFVDGRLLKPDPNWAMHAVMDKDVRDILVKNKEGADRYRNDYIDWYLVHKPAATRDEAGKFLDEILGRSEVKSGGTGPTAATMRKSEGIGLPPSMREKSIISRMRWNAHITAADLAWHRSIERNKPVATMLGLTDDGRGNAYPSGLDAYTNPATATDYMLPDIGYGKHLSINRRGEKWVEAAVGEMEAPRRAHSDNIEKWTSVANSMNLGTWTAARDVAGSFGILSGWLKPSEYGAALKAFRSLLEGKTQGVLKGQVRGKKTAEFYAQEDVYRGLALRAADIMRKYQGRDLIEKGLREFIAEIGNSIAPKRLAGALAGDAVDVRFVNEMGGKAWREQLAKPEARQKLLDRMGQRFVDTVQGNYSIDYLPGWLSRHEKGLLKATLTLSRWSFERARRFKNEIVTPMVESGDIKPLLKQSLGYVIGGAGINALSELLLDRKPREMTWREFFGLTTEEKINEFSHMLAGSAAIMGMGGMFAQLADYGQQLKHGEGNYPLQNPALRLSGDVIHKIVAYISAYGGPLDGSFWSNILSLPYEVFMDEVQLPRMVRQSVRGQQDLGNREAQILKRVAGLTKPGFRTIQDIDPFSPVGKMKRARTPEEIESLTGTLYDYYSRNKQLRPSAIPGVLESRTKTRYYDFVNRIQGPEAAAKRREVDKNQEALAGLKRAAVARAWYGAENDRRLRGQ